MDSKMCGDCGGIMWWATLLVAVLAVPSIAIVITMMFNVQGFAQILVFVLTCWISVFLGMRLMQNPKIKESMSKKE